jgi:hypothetical protein
MLTIPKLITPFQIERGTSLLPEPGCKPGLSSQRRQPLRALAQKRNQLITHYGSMINLMVGWRAWTQEAS